MLISTVDHSRLVPLVADALSKRPSPVLEALDEMLAEATLVSPAEVPADLVTMNSAVLVEVPGKDAPRLLRLVYSPPDPAAEGHVVSVLSPMGAALLGARVGSSVSLGTGAAARVLRVNDIPYQPERCGDWEL